MVASGELALAILLQFANVTGTVADNGAARLARRIIIIMHLTGACPTHHSRVVLAEIAR
jgi:hypothetical protein